MTCCLDNSSPLEEQGTAQRVPYKVTHMTGFLKNAKKKPPRKPFKKAQGCENCKEKNTVRLIFPPPSPPGRNTPQNPRPKHPQDGIWLGQTEDGAPSRGFSNPPAPEQTGFEYTDCECPGQRGTNPLGGGAQKKSFVKYPPILFSPEPITRPLGNPIPSGPATEPPTRGLPSEKGAWPSLHFPICLKYAFSCFKAKKRQETFTKNFVPVSQYLIVGLGLAFKL